MPTGHGPIDYLVVLLSILISFQCLRKKPERLLLFLPTFLTIDFFIPILSQLTPGRLVPLCIGFWLISMRKGEFRVPYKNWATSYSILIIISTFLALLFDDSGLRPIIRSLSYINLLILFIFASYYGKSRQGLFFFFHGLSYAGLLHGGYALYQIVANQVGLPYRGIVRGVGAVSSGAISRGLFRINGLADEPKRLGLVLIASVISMLVISAYQRKKYQKTWRIFLAIAVLLISLYTFSSSYLIALALWVPLCLLLSSKSYKYGAGLFAILLMLFLLTPESGKSFINNQFELLDSRQTEIVQGLDSDRIYRQELYAEDYIKTKPETILTGVGMGRYNYVLSKEYGDNAGLSASGVLNPLNSEVLQILFDLGIAGIFLLYQKSFSLLLKIRNYGLPGFCIAAILLFEIIQSFFVQTLPIMILTTGIAAAFLSTEKSLRNGYQNRGEYKFSGSLPSNRIMNL